MQCPTFSTICSICSLNVVMIRVEFAGRRHVQLVQVISRRLGVSASLAGVLRLLPESLLAFFSLLATNHECYSTVSLGSLGCCLSWGHNCDRQRIAIVTSSLLHVSRACSVTKELVCLHKHSKISLSHAIITSSI
jgi:hypothetical protein